MRNEPATGFVNDSDHMDEPEDTHFLLYFITFALVTIGGYVIYMRRNRIIALVIQGRGASSSRRRASRSSSRDSRPSGGSYRKLVNNLEEVITSSQSVKNSNVIYWRTDLLLLIKAPQSTTCGRQFHEIVDISQPERLEFADIIDLENFSKTQRSFNIFCDW